MFHYAGNHTRTGCVRSLFVCSFGGEAKVKVFICGEIYDELDPFA